MWRFSSRLLEYSFSDSESEKQLSQRLEGVREAGFEAWEESEKQLWEALAAGWLACCCLLAVAGQLGWLAGAQDFGTPESGG